jgi:hypothetical protein
MTPHPIHNLATLMQLFGEDGAVEGVRLTQLRTLCAEHGLGRWKVSPEGTSDRPALLRSMLDPHLHVFGTTANRSIGATSHDMAPGALCRLLASDYVAVIDDHRYVWRAIQDGALVPSRPTLPPDVQLPADVVRRENIHDLLWLRDTVVLPHLFPTKFERSA